MSVVLDQLAAAWTATDACAATPSSSSDSTVGDGLGSASEYWTTWSYSVLGDMQSQDEHSTDGGSDTVTTDSYGGSSGGPDALTGTSTSGGSTSASSFGYDAAGDMTSRDTPADGDQSLTWNPDGSLASVSGPGGETDYVYDADGDLLLQADPGSTTLYLPGEQLTATTVNGATTVTGARIIALPSGGDVVRTGAGSSYYFEVPDQQGTEELELDDTAQVPTWRQFTPYGAPRGETVTWADNRGFLNQPADPDTGLTYDGARAYDPVTARFISPDPVLNTSDPQDLDPYDYAEDNPVTDSDPSGAMIDFGGGVVGGNGSRADDEQMEQHYRTELTGPGGGGGGYGSSSGYGAGGCGYAGLSCHQGILGSYVPGPAPVVTPAVVSPPPAPPRPKRVTVPKSVTGSGFCTGRLMQLGACPSESGAAGTTPAQVRQSLVGAGMILSSVLPIGDLFDALLGGSAATETAEETALSAAQREAAALRAAKTAGKLEGRLPTATAAAVDRTTGELVGIGHSGDLGAPPAGLEDLLPKPSLEPWSAWNCAEVAACGEALEGGTPLENLTVRAVRTRTGELFPPCDNCASWLPGDDG